MTNKLYVTVAEFIKELKQCPQDSIIILSSDAEGNNYSPLEAISGQHNLYKPNTTWSGEIFDAEANADDYDMTESEWKKEKKKLKSAIVLWPIN